MQVEFRLCAATIIPSFSISSPLFLMQLSALHAKQDWAFFALRLIIGAIFIYHGYQKWGMWAADTQATGSMLIIMRILAIAEPLGGLALIVGAWTRLASIGLLIIMLGAIYMKMFVFGAGFAGQGGWEFDLANLGALLVLATHGAGKLSCDGCYMKKK